MAEAPAAGPTTRNVTIEVPVGIIGDGHKSVKAEARQVDANEPPPLAINSELKHIGKPTPRLDGRMKVTGAAKYTADVHPPGMLYAQLITSRSAHARIKSIDTSAAEKYPGVRAVQLLDRFGTAGRPTTRESDIPRVRFVGQPMGAVAAETQAAADEAARLVRVEYEEMPWVVDIDKAKAADAPLLFAEVVESGGTAGGGGGPRGVPQKGNVRGPAVSGRKETLEAGFAQAEVVIEAEYRTQVQTHSPLETHGVVSDWKEDGLTVHISTQGTNDVRDELARVFKLPASKVRVICEFMGGGFGAKFGASFYGSLATNLSKKAGAPVRLMLNRRDQHLSVGNRPNSHQTYKLGAKKDGTLVALHMVNYGTAGTGTGAGASRPAAGMYPIPALVTEEFDVFTNGGPGCAMRAPGHPQGAFGFEQTIDQLAEQIGMDPLALRDKIDTGDRGPIRAAQRKIGAERIGWSNRKKAGSDAGPIKRGMGMAQGMWGRGARAGTACEVRVTRDGSVELRSAVQDIGTGIRTVLAQIVAEELGLSPTDIHVKIGDTNFPAGVSSGGSTTTNSITPAAREAAYNVKRQLLELVAPALGASADALVMDGGRVMAKNDASKSMSFKAAASKMTSDEIAVRATRRRDWQGGGSGAPGGVQFMQVAVDTETGVIKVERVVAVHDCGRPMNELTAISQINGAVIQGISYALYENRLLDRQTAIMVNPNLEQYKLLGSRETPKIEAILVENYAGKSSTDAGGLAEPAIVSTPAALANAVYNAIGVRVRETPMTPARVLAALAGKTATASVERSAG